MNKAQTSKSREQEVCLNSQTKSQHRSDVLKDEIENLKRKSKLYSGIYPCMVEIKQAELKGITEEKARCLKDEFEFLQELLCRISNLSVMKDINLRITKIKELLGDGA